YALADSGAPTEDVPVPREYWPSDEWRTSTPTEQGVDTTKLDEMMRYIETNALRIDSILIVRNGYLVFEEYPSSLYSPGDYHIIHSCTKSFTSALVGIAIQNGYIGDVSDRMIDYFSNRTIANLDNRKQNITIEHLLTMTSGLEWDEWTVPYGRSGNDATDMFSSDSSTQYVLDLPMAYEPGESWTYNSGGSHLLGAIVADTAGQTLSAFAFEHLLGPLGISEANVLWPHDQEGYDYGSGGVYMRPLDMAKFGYLYLNNGSWDGQQIVPSEWVTKSAGTEVYFNEYSGYSYQWWTYPTDIANVYTAIGFAGQFIFVVPSLDMVVVFTSNTPPYQVSPQPSMLFQYIIPAILDKTSSFIPNVDYFTLSVLLVLPLPLLVAGVYSNMKLKQWPMTSESSNRRYKK
ncbi:MAG: serine hydrolase domain-containing protein, partial [Candidatus Thorarchaeota archaeon]